MNAQQSTESGRDRVASLLDMLPRFYAVLLWSEAARQLILALTDGRTLYLITAPLVAASAIGVWRAVPRALKAVSIAIAMYLPLYLFVELGPFAYVSDDGFLAPYGREQHEPRVWLVALLMIAFSALLAAAAFRAGRLRRA